MRDHRFEFYDALPSGSRDFEQRVFEFLRNWLCDESLDKRKETLDLAGWTNYAPMNIPHQENGYDCGMFALKYAQCVSLDLDLETHPFGQEHMTYFRRRAFLELMRVPMKVDFMFIEASALRRIAQQNAARLADWCRICCRDVPRTAMIQLNCSPQRINKCRMCNKCFYLFRTKCPSCKGYYR